MRETENLEFITIGVYPCVRVPRVYCVGRSEPCVWATIYGPFLYSLTLRPPPLPRPSTVHRRLCRICPVHFDSHTLVFFESLRGREQRATAGARAGPPAARTTGPRPRGAASRPRSSLTLRTMQRSFFAGETHQTCVLY